MKQKAKEKEIIMPNADEIVHEVQGEFAYHLELTSGRYTARYNSDLSHQTACFIVVKNVVDRLLEDRKKDKAFRKEKPFFQKMSYNLGEFISGQAEILIERIQAQEKSDKEKKIAENLDIKVVPDLGNLKKV